MPDPNSPENKAVKIVSLLRDYHDKSKRHVLFASAAWFAGILLSGLFLLFLLETGGYYSAEFKTIFLLILSFLAAGAAVLQFRSGSGGRHSFREYYGMFFETAGRKEVRSAVDLYLDQNQKSSRFYSSAIRANLEAASELKIREELKAYQSRSVIYKRLIQASLLCLAAFLAAAITAAVNPAGPQRVLHFWQDYSRPNPFSYAVAPGDTTVEHGSALRFSAFFDQQPEPRELHLAFKTDVEDNYRIRPMPQDGPGEFVSPEIELTGNITYYLEMDGYRSDSFHVDVQLQPRFEELTATVVPPAYTGLAADTARYPFPEIEFFRGSVIEIEGTTNKPLQSLRIENTTDDQAYQINPESDTTKNRFTARLEPSTPDTLTFQMADNDGLRNRNSYRIPLLMREDQPPVVVIQEPAQSSIQQQPGPLDIIYQATDDFGISRAELHWRLNRAFVEEETTQEQPIETPVNGRTESLRWEAGDSELRPRDTVTLYLRVWDNDEISGAKWSDSREIVLQIPSLTEQFEELDNRERNVQNELDNISENFEAMEREYREFLEQLRQNPEGGFEEEQMLEEVKNRQQEIDETVERMNEQFRQLRSEMQQSDRVSEETRQAYDDLQELMRELDDPGLLEAMQQLQEALENMVPRDLEQALENVEFNEQLYRERLERTAELFKRLKMNSDLDKLAGQYEDMAARLEEQGQEALEQLENELGAVQDDMDSVSEQLEQLDSNPPRRSAESLKRLKEQAQDQLEQAREDVDQLREEAAEKMQNGEQSPDGEMSQQQQQISEQLRQQAGQFRSSAQQMSGQQIQINILELQRSLYTLFELSDAQEYLTQTTSETRNRSQGFVELARSQKNIGDQFSSVADTLFRISSELPGIPNQINRKKAEVEQSLGRSLDQMVERNQRGATITTRESLGGINDLTSLIASLIEQLMNQQGGGGGGGMSMQQMIDQLQNMSQNQQMLNQQLQQMINDAQGERLTREQADRIDQLARQQNEIRRQLRELQQNGGLDQGDRALSELERMSEEMEEAINDMRGGITDPLMNERQQNILSRMLSAEESLQQRGETEEREGTEATDFDMEIPPDITLEELQQEIRSRLHDPDYTRFSREYQLLIERYFERLRQRDGSGRE